jgi:hypothetical protein
MMKSFKFGAAAFAMALSAAGAAHADPLGSPGMGATLSNNPEPLSVDGGPLGKVYVSGALTAMGHVTDNKVVGSDRIDLGNAHINIQTTEGPIQFFVQGGAYTQAVVGLPIGKTVDVTKANYGVVPLAYVKFVPSDTFNIMVGKMPTIIGAELPYTYQNINIQRGMLWYQENVIVRGAQANFTSGPISASVQLSDGFYSGKYTWLNGLLSFNLGGGNSLALVAGGNLSSGTSKVTSATPLEANNSEIYNVIFTHAAGPWTIIPYFQYTHVPTITKLGISKGSTTSAALLVNYKFNDSWSLAARGEWLSTKGAPVFQYSPGTDSYSLTVTPTWTAGRFFIRGEGSYVGISDFAPGAGFGSTGSNKGQLRGMIETGVLF